MVMMMMMKEEVHHVLFTHKLVSHSKLKTKHLTPSSHTSIKKLLKWAQASAAVLNLLNDSCLDLLSNKISSRWNFRLFAILILLSHFLSWSSIFVNRKSASHHAPYSSSLFTSLPTTAMGETKLFLKKYQKNLKKIA